MRKRTTNNRASGGSKPAGAGQRNAGGTSSGGFFKRTKTEVESRFSKPSIKKSALRKAAADDRNKPASHRPNFDHAKPDSGDGRPEKRDFKKYDKGPREFGEGRESASKKPFGRSERSGDRPAFKGKPESGRFSDRPRTGRFSDKAAPARFEDKPRNERPEPRSAENNADQEQEVDRSGLERRVGRFERAPHYDLSGYENKKAPRKKEKEKEEKSDLIRLNRYIANAGICSRRDADELIASGQITVNGKVTTEMGYKVKISDTVKYGRKALNPEKMVYILMNKPKGYITTTDDPEERKTVLEIIAGACSERVYPVGRLDRNTTGLLLLTNDGELAKKLTHPSSGIKKIYQAELDKPMLTEDFEHLQKGVELEDGFIRPDQVGIVTPDAMVIGLEIHSGRNRIVRRMFENLGYEVQKLDRTVFAGLDKKDLPRGKWRFLSEKEVVKLKFLL